MLPAPARRKADVVVSALFVLLGAYVIYEASQMPWVRGRHQWYTSPALFPTIVGALLIVFSLKVLAVAVKEGGHRELVGTFGRWLLGLPRNFGVHRVVFAMVWIGLYIFVGLGNYPYQLVSAGFLAVFIGLFWLPGAGADWPKRLVITLAVAFAVPYAIAYVFSTFLFVPAP
jgi:hypothetical protein